MASKLGSIFQELRRRQVFKVAVAYAVVAWLLIQMATSVFPSLGLQPWTVTLVIVLIAVGFPVALVLAWAYELQPAARRSAEDEPSRPAPAQPSSAPATTAPGTTESLATDAAAGSASATAPGIGSDHRPALAVLPFLNMMGDPAQEYFADGMTEDLITDLSKISGLCVIARNSSFTFKGQAVDVREAARTLGARYVVEGSVRKAGNRVRFNAQLIDAQSGAHVWAERYDGDLADVFALQDEILSKIVSALRVNLKVGERARLETRLTNDLAAYDLFLKGRNEFYRFTPASSTAAIELLEQAVARDPRFATAYAYLSEAHSAHAMLSASPVDFEAGLKKANEAARTAVACDESLGLAHGILAWTQIWLRQYDAGMASFERAMALAPNDVEVLGHYATALNYIGEPERAMDIFDRAARLDPLLPANIRFSQGVTLYLLQRHEEALDVLQTVMHLAPAFYGPYYICAALLAELGRDEEARAVAAEARRLSGPHTAAELLRRVPMRDRGIRERIASGFRAAGLLD